MTLWTVARQAPLSMRFSRQEYWSGLPFPSPGDLPNLGIKHRSFMSPAFAGGLFTTSTTWRQIIISFSFCFSQQHESPVGLKFTGPEVISHRVGQHLSVKLPQRAMNMSPLPSFSRSSSCWLKCRSDGCSSATILEQEEKNRTTS